MTSFRQFCIAVWVGISVCFSLPSLAQAKKSTSNSKKIKQAKTSMRGKFLGFTKVYNKTKAEAIGLLGRPTVDWRDYHFHEGDPSDFKDTLYYANWAGSKYIAISVAHGKVDGLSAVYAAKPTTAQLQVLLGATGKIKIKENEKDKYTVITYTVSDAMKPLPEDSTGDKSGMMLPLTKDFFKSDESPSTQGFVKYLKQFGAKVGGFFVEFPR